MLWKPLFVDRVFFCHDNLGRTVATSHGRACYVVIRTVPHLLYVFFYVNYSVCIIYVLHVLSTFHFYCVMTWPERYDFVYVFWRLYFLDTVVYTSERPIFQ